MQGYDFIMLAVVGVAILLGYRKGLAWQVASLGSIVVSYLVAYRFHDQLAVHIDVGAPWNKFVAMLILYLATSLCIWFLFRLVRGFLDKAKLKEFDHHLGAVFGGAKGVLLCVVITLFAVSLLSPQVSESIVNSKSGYYIAKLLDRSAAMVPPELHEKLAPLLAKLDERFEVARPEGSGTYADPLAEPSIDPFADGYGQPEPRQANRSTDDPLLPSREYGSQSDWR